MYSNERHHQKESPPSAEGLSPAPLSNPTAEALINGHLPQVGRSSILKTLTSFQHQLLSADGINELLDLYRRLGETFDSAGSFVARVKADWKTLGDTCVQYAKEHPTGSAEIPIKTVEADGVRYALIGVIHRYGMNREIGDVYYSSIRERLNEFKHVLFESGARADAATSGVEIPDALQGKVLNLFFGQIQIRKDKSSGTFQQEVDSIAKETTLFTAHGLPRWDVPIETFTNRTNVPPQLELFLYPGAKDNAFYRYDPSECLLRSAYMAEFAKGYAKHAGADNLVICCGAAHVGQIAAVLRDGFPDSGLVKRARSAGGRYAINPQESRYKFKNCCPSLKRALGITMGLGALMVTYPLIGLPVTATTLGIIKYKLKQMEKEATLKISVDLNPLTAKLIKHGLITKRE